MGEALWKKNFYLMSGGGDSVSKDDFILLCRACGQLMTPSEAESVAAGVGGKVSYDEFASQMGKGTFGPSEEKLLDSLLAFDGNESGFLNKRDIIDKLTSIGDTMGLEEAHKVFAKFPVDDTGAVDIRAFQQYLINPVPLLDPDPEMLKKELDLPDDAF
eukprot:NODE_2219_length_623_cov_47.495968_g2169_i0.p1 GENE.NODE_2219_length_623_cov_47.495968_g2169_i0~~NODE_2219_length_623_cov_47.495968_g2169_i0.p1  ORF type:complete len:176 (+),score=55.10 NODE_2219_length_623_cov_47.495968_g2169_i0:53-529(+)